MEPTVLHKALVINISPVMQVDPSGNEDKVGWGKVVESEDFSKSGSQLMLFAVSSLLDQASFECVTSKGGRVVWLQDIRKAKMTDSATGASTQAGQQLDKILQASEEVFDVINVNFNLEAVIVCLFMHACRRAQWLQESPKRIASAA